MNFLKELIEELWFLIIPIAGFFAGYNLPNVTLSPILLVMSVFPVFVVVCKVMGIK